MEKQETSFSFLKNPKAKQLFNESLKNKVPEFHYKELGLESLDEFTELVFENAQMEHYVAQLTSSISFSFTSFKKQLMEQVDAAEKATFSFYEINPEKVKRPFDTFIETMINTLKKVDFEEVKRLLNEESDGLRKGRKTGTAQMEQNPERLDNEAKRDSGLKRDEELTLKKIMKNLARETSILSRRVVDEITQTAAKSKKGMEKTTEALDALNKKLELIGDELKRLEESIKLTNVKTLIDNTYEVFDQKLSKFKKKFSRFSQSLCFLGQQNSEKEAEKEMKLKTSFHKHLERLNDFERFFLMKKYKECTVSS